MKSLALAGIDAHTWLRITALVLYEHRAAANQSTQRIAEIKSIDVIERHEVDMLQLRVGADRLLGDGQKVSRRQTFFLRAVHRVCLDA